MKPHQISAFFLLMTVLLSSTLADERLYVFCEAAALQEPTTHWQEISSGIMHTTADHGLLTSSHKEDRQSRLAASPARPEAPQREKVDGLITGGQPKNGAAASKESVDWPQAPKKEKVDGLITGRQLGCSFPIYSYQPDRCCHIYFSGRLRMALIAGCEGTRADCPKPGIILYTKSDRELCVDPSDRWVQEVMKRLDQRFFQ